MSGSVRSIHSLLARELTISEIKMVSGGQTCGEGNTEVTTEPTYCDTAGGSPWDTSDRCDDDGSWDVSCD
ncbi:MULTISPECIES: hypothetical protein [Sphingobium]|jgi:hypothetical protein|uniref:Uncharacterized protein n=1 Tax=Sphingobium yanoikuyae TaxID=13690 RepID=A0AA42WUK5_SPHYA|nr:MULTISPECIES: hypothetical protein [Sphingobium]MDF0544958.1 hypothetical protein [Sphingobium arseniciresistens]MBV2150699.1 hypothetical protein [Sphingobium sp. AS12]MDH2130686.1 hypothetical protein [Sphingobium yanoikuyae]MDH2149843.1 hypothetical protein [Sphingobium yanoikuyae]MDH2166117.1 hypothetical protein [Sphingobium yanoikuyae]|tara:strand:+ start:12545 stop:12754 length:210 start_codon:yes stop_codon:yes gene_type:complete